MLLWDGLLFVDSRFFLVVDVEFVSLVVMVVDYGFEVVMGCVDLYVFIFLKFFERERV